MTSAIKPRQLAKYQYGKPTLYLSSHKNNRLIWCESRLERDRALALEYDDSVIRYQSQPLSFVYPASNGRISRYTPDFFVQRADGFVFEEVKHLSRTLSAAFRGHHQLLDIHSQRRFGCPLLLVTDQDLRVADTIANYKLLYRYRRVTPPDWSRQMLRANLGKFPLFAELKDYVARKGLSPTKAFALLFYRRFCFDFTQRLTEQTELEIL